MKVEFTKELQHEGKEIWKDLIIAVNERPDNLDVRNLSEDKKKVLEKLQTSSGSIVLLEDFKLLLEMAAQTRKLWKPGSILKVFFFGGQDARTQKVLEYASIWSKYCSIKFEATTKIEEAKIRVAFQAASSWSYIGTDALGVPIAEPTVNFGWLDDTLPEKDYKQVVLHEFGHVLGLIHEHQSPAVKVNWNKTYVYCYFQEHHNWTKDDVDKNLFQAFETTSSQYSKLDKLSIMGYYIPPEFTNDGQEFPLNFDLSAMDKVYIQTLYPRILHS